MTVVGRDTFFSDDDFNSHAHVERDCKIDDAPIFKRISTHTLTWSVTQGGSRA